MTLYRVFRCRYTLYMFIPAQVGVVKGSQMLNLLRQLKWRNLLRPLVRKSATWDLEGTKTGEIAPTLILSLTKWQTISICYVLARWTWLEAKAIVESLSHIIMEGVGTVSCNSLRRHLSQVTSQVQSASSLYSVYFASVEDLETPFFFLESQLGQERQHTVWLIF